MRLSLLVLFPALFLAGCDSSGSGGDEGELVIHEITIGTGESIDEGTTIIVTYTGKLSDGTVFDSSDLSGELIFTPGAETVVQGLEMGVIGMKVGGTRRLEIPSHLGFGRNGFCTSTSECPVPSNADIEFEITIVDILDYVLVETLIVGTGEAVMTGDRVKIQYAVALQNGSVIDSSVDDSYLEFTIGSDFLIDGLHEGMQGMRTGGSRLLTIPPELAYGPFGDRTGTVPPYAVLIFRVDLIEKVIPEGS